MNTYVFCPEAEHMKAAEVCYRKCKRFHKRICIKIEKIYMAHGYEFTRKRRQS